MHYPLTLAKRKRFRLRSLHITQGTDDNRDLFLWLVRSDAICSLESLALSDISFLEENVDVAVANLFSNAGASLKCIEMGSFRGTTSSLQLHSNVALRSLTLSSMTTDQVVAILSTISSRDIRYLNVSVPARAIEVVEPIVDLLISAHTLLFASLECIALRLRRGRQVVFKAREAMEFESRVALLRSVFGNGCDISMSFLD